MKETNTKKQTNTAHPKSSWYLEDHMAGLYFGGKFDSETEKRFHLETAPCYLLLYVFSGSGAFSIGDRTRFLSQRNVLFLDCIRPTSLHITPSGMSFGIFFLRREEVTPYYRQLSADAQEPFILTASPYLEYYILQLLRLLPIESREKTAASSKWIISILSEFLNLAFPEYRVDEQIPDYILEMKEVFDLSYQKPFRLDEMAKRLSINKYRLCREFSHWYGSSPLQYLNARRIEASKDLLLTTSMKVYEVGNAVGIENTNHFINQFKKSTGMTPMQFRKKAHS